MPKFKKKAVEAPVESEETVENSVETVENITAEEKDAIQKDTEVSVASTAKLELANQLLAKVFNIDDSFQVTSVKDGGNHMTIGFANIDYEVTIKIKNCEEIGLVVSEE